MKIAIWLILAAALLSTKLSAQHVEYTAEIKGDSLFPNVLLARVNGRTYTVIDASKGMCMEIVDQRDWDGDGRTDVLMKNITACGGNCCPNKFFFVSARGNGRFEVSDDLADSWGEPVIEKWKNAWSVVIVSTNEGINTARAREVTSRYVLRNGNGVEVESSERKEMESLLDLRSEVFEGKGADEKHSIKFDLDGDGKEDVISATLWERWGRMRWSVAFANGKEFSTDTACKRVGVLRTTTKGVHDLVCDQDTVFRWTGSEYAEADDSAATGVKPSFDCGKASTRVELLICRDGSLAALEVEMAAAYKEALGRLAAASQTALRRDHAAWFAAYSRTCNAASEADRAACVGRYLTEHTAELKKRL